ncbi:MAG TPA: hypothetical protein GXZ61_05520 [Clostridiales bacterium]|jgi:hypothetical protein|nr:hypothetical protein [Clostridiales bacterium]
MHLAERIANTLLAYGLSEKYLGFHYMVFILSNYAHEDFLFHTMTEIYNELADEFGVSHKAIQKNLTYFVKKCFEEVRNANFSNLFAHYDTNHLPSSKEFVTLFLAQKKEWMKKYQN